MIPALIGNIIGGGLFVGVVYWYLVSRLQESREFSAHQASSSWQGMSKTDREQQHLTNEPPVPIDGVYFSTDKEPLFTLGSKPWKSGGGLTTSGNNSPPRSESSERKKSAEAMV